jgi:hypothetical protein
MWGLDLWRLHVKYGNGLPLRLRSNVRMKSKTKPKPKGPQPVPFGGITPPGRWACRARRIDGDRSRVGDRGQCACALAVPDGYAQRAGPVAFQKWLFDATLSTTPNESKSEQTRAPKAIPFGTGVCEMATAAVHLEPLDSETESAIGLAEAWIVPRQRHSSTLRAS